MTDLRATALHPAPVRYVPVRGRAERHAFERIASPVTLRQADDAAFEPLPLTSDASSVFWRRGLHEHEGALWLAVTAWDDVAKGDRPIRPEGFLAFLRGDEGLPPNLALALPKAFRGTPLMACHWDPYAVEDRLDPGGPIPESRTLTDERDRASRSLRAYLDRDVRVSGERVWLRATPMAVTTLSDGYPQVRCLDPVDRLVLRTGQPIPVRADLGNAMLEAVEGGLRRMPCGPDAPPPSRLIGDDDLSQLACQGPILLERAARTLRSHARSPQGRAEVPPGIDRTIAEMAILAQRGRIGAVFPDEVEPTLLAVARGADLVERMNGHGMTVPGLAALAAHIRVHALPRLDAVRPEEEASLSLLAP